MHNASFLPFFLPSFFHFHFFFSFLSYFLLLNSFFAIFCHLFVPLWRMTQISEVGEKLWNRIKIVAKEKKKEIKQPKHKENKME